MSSDENFKDYGEYRFEFKAAVKWFFIGPAAQTTGHSSGALPAQELHKHAVYFILQEFIFNPPVLYFLAYKIVTGAVLIVKTSTDKMWCKIYRSPYILSAISCTNVCAAARRRLLFLRFFQRKLSTLFMRSGCHILLYIIIIIHVFVFRVFMRKNVQLSVAQ